VEAAILRTHDEKVLLGVSPDEVARFRPQVEAQADAVAAGLRAAHLARTTRQP
jgi:hypothetical protein